VIHKISLVWSAIKVVRLQIALISVNTGKSHKGMAGKFYDYEST